MCSLCMALHQNEGRREFGNLELISASTPGQQWLIGDGKKTPTQQNTVKRKASATKLFRLHGRSWWSVDPTGPR